MKAEPAVISGKVINGKGLTIRLMTYIDQVSYMRQTLQSMVINDDELFSLSAEISKVKYCWLDIEFQQAELFIQPGQTYEVEIDLKNRSLSTTYYDRAGLPYKIIKDDNDHLNLSIQDFNQLYNDFLLDNAQSIRAGKAKAALDTFQTAIELRFQNAKNQFFLDYLKYKFASMQLFMRLKSRETIGLEFIAGQPVLYSHLEYMDFFHLYFEKYFITGGKYFDFNKTYDMVNGAAGMSDLLDSLRHDPALAEAPARELLMLDGLKELYYDPSFKRERVIGLVTDLSKNGSVNEIRELASNLLSSFKRLQPGSPAPTFNLPGVNDGHNYHLEDFNGKYVYLAFFDSQNPASQSELAMIPEIFEEYQNKVNFIAVSVDKDMALLGEYLQKAEIPWTVLHFNGNIDLLEQYDASTYPYFVLINETGQIYRCPSPSPSENIKKVFNSF